MAGLVKPAGQESSPPFPVLSLFTGEKLGKPFGEVISGRETSSVPEAALWYRHAMRALSTIGAVGRTSPATA
jgi:hypothetical protein